ncbi:MAG: P-type conjugative transfer protein VirB9 [Snodgrassella sp.]|uniref:P-type conjugative transfer protein VirB9 n=1 Tax=Snodgrassella sp. TaxID=2815304 RepID=UPI0025846A43|nr:P-type conjugative transfer protein VirB9 [Snodgrassella sp.]MCO6521231.1 P-type conjugative transfer protein VirB9 [Snodgrassella sp.]
MTALSAVLVSPAWALDYPAHSARDARIQYVNYASNDVFLVRGAVGVATQIIFEPDEQILEMASGFSEGWELVDKRNNIYIKPKIEKANTNLVVTTNKRVYAFDLKVVSTKNHPTYRLAFHYPDTIRANKDKEVEKQLVESSFKNATSSFKDATNTNYTMEANQYAEEITPIEAFDDGRFTYIKFEKNSDMPVIYKVGADKQETIVNTHIQNGYLIVHGIYKVLAIRAGKAVVGLYNESYSGGGADITGTGTVSPDVQREIKDDE